MERKEYKRYSRGFQLEAVRLASLGEKPKAQIVLRLRRKMLQSSDVRTPASGKRTSF
jgi:hypothetical protein